MAASSTLRVLSIPSDHPYVRHALPSGGRLVVLDDPTDPWWPPAALEPEWLRSHPGAADLVHLHFGFEHRSPEQLRGWCNVLAELGIALVVTVHDLRNPHLLDNGPHEHGLAVLIDAAQVVLTLTAGAADEVRRRYGRRAAVIAHPHIVPIGRAAQPTAAGTVGVHLRNGRANVLPPEQLIPAIAAAVDEGRGSLVVRANSNGAAPMLRELERLQRTSTFELHITPRLDDDELFDDLSRLHVAVLPYTFGTHSGWLEACRDVGTRVVAPDCGYYADQWADVESFHIDRRGAADVSTLTDAVRRALDRPAPPPIDADRRRDQQLDSHAAHRHAYDRALRLREQAVA